MLKINELTIHVTSFRRILHVDPGRRKLMKGVLRGEFDDMAIVNEMRQHSSLKKERVRSRSKNKSQFSNERSFMREVDESNPSEEVELSHKLVA